MTGQEAVSWRWARFGLLAVVTSWAVPPAVPGFQSPEPLPGPRPVALQAGGSERPDEGDDETPRYRYDWYAREGTEVRAARPGRTLIVEIVRLNTLCFDYSISSTEVQTTARTGPWFTILGGGDLAKHLATLTGSDRADAAADTTPGEDDDGVRADASEPPAVVASLVRSARDSLEAGRTVVLTAVRRQTEARSTIEAVYERACRGGMAPDDVEAWWNGSGDAFDGLGTGEGTLLGRAAVLHDSARVLLGRADEIWQRNAERYPDEADRIDSLLRAADDEADRLEAAIEVARNEIAMTLAARDGVEAALGRTRRTVSIPVGRSGERIDVTIRAEGREGLPDGFEARTQEEVFSIDVHRRSRFFLSSGFLASFLNAPDYERSTLPVPLPRDTVLFPGTGDTYSTFTNRGDPADVSIAPVIVGTVAFELTESVGWGPSVGLAPRSVNDETGLDFVVGLTLVVGDVLTTTLGWHRGRVENLLLGDPLDVAGRPVAAGVTDESAVGVKWEHGMALLVGLVLPP